MDRTISHISMVDEDSSDRVGICGTEIEDAIDGVDLPVCIKCSQIMMAAYADACQRIVDIGAALEMRDELNQTNLIHHVTEDALSNAFWRPGPLHPEGPMREDGSF